MIVLLSHTSAGLSLIYVRSLPFICPEVRAPYDRHRARRVLVMKSRKLRAATSETIEINVD